MEWSILALMVFSLAAYGCADIGNKAYQDRVAKNLAVVENHFHSEWLSDVEKALETFTDDVVWDAPAPNGLNWSFAGKEAAGNNYRRLRGAMRNVKFQQVQRFATEDRVVDDSIITFEVLKDGYFNLCQLNEGITSEAGRTANPVQTIGVPVDVVNMVCPGNA